MGIGIGFAWDLWFLAAPPLIILVPWISNATKSDDRCSGARQRGSRAAGCAPAPEPEHPT